MGLDHRARAAAHRRQLHESVGGEWSFVDTLRHLVFAMDKCFTTLILGDEEFQHIRYAVRDLAHLE